MKTLLTLVLSAMLTISFSHGKTLNDPDPLTVQEQINRKVNFKSFARENQIEGKVEVTFYIDELHMIRIQCIYGDTDHMVNYVKKKIDKQEIYGEDLHINQSYKMIFEYHETNTLGLRPKSIQPNSSNSL